MSVPATPADEPPNLAAEYALGLLEGNELAGARAQLGNAGFRADVAHWLGHFVPLLDEVAPVRPPARLWTAIEQRISPAAPRSADVHQLHRRLNLWRGAAAVATALAASLALVVLTRPEPVAPPAVTRAPAPMVAMLGDEQAGGLMLAKWEPSNGRMTVAAPTEISIAAGQVQELWVIQADGTPRSLGVLPSTSRNELQIAPSAAQQLQQGATLAVSVEPQGGSRTGLPTGPVIASGKLGLV